MQSIIEGFDKSDEILLKMEKLIGRQTEHSADQSEPTRPHARQPQGSSIIWPAYVGDCGTKAQRENSARSVKAFRERYKGRRVRWTGEVSDVRLAMLGGGYTVLIKMAGSTAFVADLALVVPKSLADTVLALNSGEVVEFVGVINTQGGAILPHQINVTELRKKP